MRGWPHPSSPQNRQPASQRSRYQSRWRRMPFWRIRRPWRRPTRMRKESGLRWRRVTDSMRRGEGESVQGKPLGVPKARASENRPEALPLCPTESEDGVVRVMWALVSGLAPARARGAGQARGSGKGREKVERSETARGEASVWLTCSAPFGPRSNGRRCTPRQPGDARGRARWISASGSHRTGRWSASRSSSRRGMTCSTRAPCRPSGGPARIRCWPAGCGSPSPISSRASLPERLGAGIAGGEGIFVVPE